MAGPEVIGKHLVCDECGARTDAVSFEESITGDIEVSFDHLQIINKQKPQTRPMSGIDWVKRAAPDPDDPIAIEFTHFCGKCAAEQS